MTDKKKSAISKTLEKTLEDIQTSVTNVVGKFDELKEMIQKNVNDNIDKIKGLSQNTQEMGKKYVDSVLTLVPFKDLLDKLKGNDYKELAIGIKSELEKKFNVSIDQILNAFNIASTLDIKELTKKLEKLEKERDSGVLEKYNKKEQLGFQKEIDRLTYLVGGIRTMTTLPGAVFMVDLKEDKTPRLEAAKCGLSIVSLVDTNINPDGISYPIPGNDDAIRSLELFCKAVSETIIEGQAAYEKNKAELQQKVADEEAIKTKKKTE